MNTLYLRKSTADQRFDSQELQLREYCERRGWKDFQTFSDTAGGAKTDRAGLEKLMAAVRAGKVSRLIVYKLDRMGRSLTHLALILDELQRHGVALIATSQGIDTGNENPAGRLQLNVLMAVAQFEREIIRDRVNSGIAAARKRGVRFGRPRKHQWTEADLKALQAEGLGVRAISRQLKMPVSSVSIMLKAARVTVNSGKSEAAGRPSEASALQPLGPAADMQPATL
jgi:putative DNA-invertase from lambdoid prophage Rac